MDNERVLHCLEFPVPNQEMYNTFDHDSGQVKSTPTPDEDDPFWEPLEPRLVGFAPAFLQPLAYGLDFADGLQINDLDGKPIGKLYVNLQPCLSSGKVPTDDDNIPNESLFVENPKELLGKPFYFKVNGLFYSATSTVGESPEALVTSFLELSASSDTSLDVWEGTVPCRYYSFASHYCKVVPGIDATTEIGARADWGSFMAGQLSKHLDSVCIRASVGS